MCEIVQVNSENNQQVEHDNKPAENNHHIIQVATLIAPLLLLDTKDFCQKSIFWYRPVHLCSCKSYFVIYTNMGTDYIICTVYAPQYMCMNIYVTCLRTENPLALHRIWLFKDTSLLRRLIV